MNRKIFYWHIAGVFFTILFGSFLHFTFQLSGGSKAVALISAVNESTWEHLKIGFWPAFIFGIFEYFTYGRKIKNFWSAKALALLIIPVTIVVFFYGYSIFIKHNLFLDISIFMLAIILSYVASYKIIKSEKDFSEYNKFFVTLVILLALSFCLFSYFPLHNFLFKDPVSGGYGIIN